ADADREVGGRRAAVTRGRTDRDQIGRAPCRDGRAGAGGDGGRGVDREQAARVVFQAVADRGAGIGVGAQRGDANRGANRGVLGDGVGRRVAVGQQDRVVIDVADADREVGGRRAAVTRGRTDRD